MLINDLKALIGDNYIITAKWNKQQFIKGWRYGEGEALAVVKPGSLLEIWKILKICVKAETVLPIGVNAPKPVTTTRRSFIKFYFEPSIYCTVY